MDNLTIVYYTANRESELFEARIRAALMESAAGVPIIVVSQRPVNVVGNICVGQIGVSPEHAMTQARIGTEAAKTDFVALAESDCLFPPDYFEFKPKRPDTYYYAAEAYVIWEGRNTFWRKKFQEVVGVVHRKHLLDILDAVLAQPEEHVARLVKQLSRQETFETEAPVVTIKTHRGMHWTSPCSRKGAKRELPMWGKAEDIWRRFPCAG